MNYVTRDRTLGMDMGVAGEKEQTLRAILKMRKHRPGARNDSGINGFKSA